MSDQNWEPDHPEDEGVVWIDESGNELGFASDEDAAVWAQENGYDLVVERPFYTPDLPDQYGLTDREAWPTDPNERRAAREAAAQRMYQERIDNGW